MCKIFRKNGNSYDKKTGENQTNWNAWSWVIMLLYAALCVGAFWLLPNLYNDVIQQSEVHVSVTPQIRNALQGTLPSAVMMNDSVISTRKYINNDDKVILSTLVERSDTAVYTKYMRAVDELAYKSNELSADALQNLMLLTLCFVMLGCVARTFYDYIGRKCYKKRQDMSVWWPWYVFRPLIGAPIAAFIIVASRCAMFSALFTAKDLNTYLVISFLAGFAMMEFLSMVRSTSKGLFERNEKPQSENKETENQNPPLGGTPGEGGE